MTYLPTLAYHRLIEQEPTREIDPRRIAMSTSLFRRHLAMLKRFGYQTMDLAEYPALLRAGRHPPARQVAITFDDGYAEMLTLACPILREFGYTATVFALPALAGQTNRWDDGNAPLLTTEALRELDRSGVRVESHTNQHLHLTRIGSEAARTELTESRRHLEAILGRRVSLVAYPYGETDTQIERIAEEAGYEAAFATDRAPRDHAARRYALRRVVVFPHTSPWQLLLKVQPWYPAYQDWKRK